MSSCQVLLRPLQLLVQLPCEIVITVIRFLTQRLIDGKIDFQINAAADGFVDVTNSTSHHEEIDWLAEQGISKGWTMKDGTVEFRPYNNVARADMAAFLHRLHGHWG